MSKLRRRSIAVSLTALAASTLVGVGTAEAHQRCENLGANYVCVSSDHLTVGVHDEECDNHRVYARVQHHGTINPNRYYDPNGCSAGGGYVTFYPISEVTQFQVCEETYGCGWWWVN